MQKAGISKQDFGKAVPIIKSTAKVLNGRIYLPNDGPPPEAKKEGD